MRERAEFNKSCSLIGSGSGRNFPIQPALGGRNRHLLKNISILSGNVLNDLFYYVSKNLSVKPISSTWIISVFITICSLDIVQFVANLAVITALKCSGLSHAFRCLVEKNKNVIHQPRSVRIGKNCALCIQNLGHSFSQYGPPGWWIIYIFYLILVNVTRNHVRARSVYGKLSVMHQSFETPAPSPFGP